MKDIAETKVKGLKVKMDNHYITIFDSYQIISLDKMNEILDDIQNKPNCFYSTKRTRQSLINEWVAHNRLYKRHMFKKHTKDCTFERKINPILNFSYKILGFCKGDRIWKKKKKKKLPLSWGLCMTLIKIWYKIPKRNFLKVLSIVKKKK